MPVWKTFYLGKWKKKEKNRKEIGFTIKL